MLIDRASFPINAISEITYRWAAIAIIGDTVIIDIVVAGIAYLIGV